MNNINSFISKYKYIIMSVIILLLVAGIIFVCIYFYSDSDSNINQKTTVANSDNIASVDKSDDVLAGDSSILVVCNSETIGEAMFMTLFNFHILSESIIITPIDMDISDGTRTFAQSYSYGGINELVASIENVRNCKIDRYAVIDKSGIGELTNILGKINLYVTEEYTYLSSDKSYSVSTGYNNLESEMLYGYFKIYCNKADGNDKIAELLCTIVNSYLAGIDVNQAQELFGKLCNCVNTDITISDYYTCSSDIEYLLTHDTKCFVYNKGE